MTTATLDKDFAAQRLISALKVIDGLLAGDWPYSDPKDALVKIRAEFSSQLEAILGLTKATSDGIVAAHCLEARSRLHRYSPYLGFILRSSNVRNSFEIYDPIKRLGRLLVGDDICLVLASEWNYAPFAFPIPSDPLDHFVFVGIPATETQNALLTPVAGHELGHAAWRSAGADRPILRKVFAEAVAQITSHWEEVKGHFKVPQTDIALDLDALSVWRPLLEYSNRQAEEVFCDLLGLRIFGTSFLHTFRYLLAPDLGTRPSPLYPSPQVRAGYLVKAAGRWNFAIDDFSVHLFKTPENVDDKWIIWSDAVTAAVFDEIYTSVDELCKRRAIPLPDGQGMNNALRLLHRNVPATDITSYGDILNAAWEIRRNLGDWSIPGVKDERKISILNDLVLKSFEVAEWASIRK